MHAKYNPGILAALHILGMQEACVLGPQEPCVLAMQESLKSPNPGFAHLVGLKMVFGRQTDISGDLPAKIEAVALFFQGAPCQGHARTQ